MLKGIERANCKIVCRCLAVRSGKYTETRDLDLEAGDASKVVQSCPELTEMERRCLLGNWSRSDFKATFHLSGSPTDMYLDVQEQVG